MIYTVILAACVGFFLVEVVKWHFMLERFMPCTWTMNRKPFNCVPCVSAWFGLLIGLSEGMKWNSIDALFFSAVAGLVLKLAIEKLYQ